MPTTEEKTETKQLEPLTPEKRELLIRYLGAKPPEKPIELKEFNLVRNYIDRYRCGLTKEAYEMVKDDKELVKAAAINQVHRDHRIMDRRTPEIRHVLLKALRSPPGEKRLSLPEFKQVAVFLDFKHGGIRRHAFELFKDDPEIVEAAKKNRDIRLTKEVSQDKSKSPEKDPFLERVKSNTEKAIDAVRSRRSRQASMDRSMGPEIGE